MDEYTKEIADLERQVENLVDSDGDRDTIADLSMQLDILRALLTRANELYRLGEHDETLRLSLAARGYGEWSFDNVYAFVYEQSVDMPAESHRSFVGEIRETDFAGLLDQSA